MGKLKSAIEKLQKKVGEVPKQIDALNDERSKGNDRVTDLVLKAIQGYDLMFMHLTQKFKKSGSTLDANGSATLKSVMDSELTKYIGGIENFAKDIVKLIDTVNASQKKSYDRIASTISSAESEAKKLKAEADKRMKKWLVSKAYKANAKSYAGSVDNIVQLLKKLSASAKKASALTRDAGWVKKNLSVPSDIRLSGIKSLASMDGQNLMKAYLANEKEADAYVRSFRDEYKGVAGQMATMKKWSADADAMEKESD